MVATARIKGLPTYRGYRFVIVEGKGVHLRCPDGELVKVQIYGRYYSLGILAGPELEKVFRGFVDRREAYRGIRNETGR